VSARQLVDDSIVRLVADALQRHRLPGAALCLEITESILVNDQNVERLRMLRRLGVWLAVDDFGTGYSSLSYLHRMPISKVKIDKAFIDEIGDGDPSIMVAILSMAHSLGLACVAEGVETEQQASRLHDLGCDHAQGYFWSRPMPADMIMHVLGDPASVA
jgi:EAL domain-containing protein (putative c-di-GMP-specific phosphodiesterase class I)